MSSIDRLKAILETDEDGEIIADILNNMLINDRKRNIFFTKLINMQRQLSKFGQEIKLTKSEEAVKELILKMNRPLTSQDVAEKISEDYKSLKYRTHASTALNSLVNKGILGKIKQGYVYYYTTPKEAVIEQLKRRGETPYECSPEEISDESGIPIDTVLDVLEMLLS